MSDHELSGASDPLSTMVLYLFEELLYVLVCKAHSGWQLLLIGKWDLPNVVTSRDLVSLNRAFIDLPHSRGHLLLKIYLQVVVFLL